MTTPSTAEELRAAQATEYGTYTAKEAIRLDGVLAFNAGDAVPVSHVKRGIVASAQVDKTEKKG